MLLGTGVRPSGRAVRALRVASEWVMPVTITRHGMGDHRSHLSALYGTSDTGSSWRKTRLISTGGQGLVDAQVVRPTDHRGVKAVDLLVALLRSRDGSCVHRSESRNGGKTWSPPQPTPLPNDDRGLAAVALAEPQHVLAVFVDAGGCGGRALDTNATVLSVAVSMNRGVTWTAPRAVDWDDSGERKYDGLTAVVDAHAVLHVAHEQPCGPKPPPELTEVNRTLVPPATRYAGSGTVEEVLPFRRETCIRHLAIRPRLWRDPAKPPKRG